MSNKIRIKKFITTALILCAYIALYSAQISFVYIVNVLENKSEFSSYQNNKTTNNHNYSFEKKNSSHKINVRLNKRFQKENFDFIIPDEINLGNDLYYISCLQFHYNEPRTDSEYSICITRGPPADTI